jgi:ABC-type dipeptide/oligopeptide/nickel transport system permease subunit
LRSELGNSRRAAKDALLGFAWRVHTFARLFWGPEAACPVPHGDSPKRSRLAAAAGSFRRSPAFYTGLALIGMVALGGILVPLLTPYAPDALAVNERLQPPSWAHPFGTDALGRDMLSRVASGAHLAAKMALVSVSMSLAIGLILGSQAGYHSGWLDQILSRIVDGWLALPGALVAVIIVARLGASLDNLILALGIMGVPAFYRMVRNTTLSARHMPYAEAAISLGATDTRVMWMHVFPNIVSPLVVVVTMRLGTALLTGSSLSFIGLGAQPPLPEWGALLAAGRNYMASAWWLALFPGLAVTMTVVGLNLLGDGLRDLLDPRMVRARRHGDGIAVEARPEQRPTRSAAPLERFAANGHENVHKKARADEPLVGISRR